jgi:hypothetical protein
MNKGGNPLFSRGNQLARKARGVPKKPAIAHLLEEFAPDVVNVVRAMLTSDDPQAQWTCAKEILPYLWPKKASVAVQDDKPAASLADYLNAKTPPASESSPSVSVPVEAGNGVQ